MINKYFINTYEMESKTDLETPGYYSIFDSPVVVLKKGRLELKLKKNRFIKKIEKEIKKKKGDLQYDAVLLEKPTWNKNVYVYLLRKNGDEKNSKRE